jgi:bacterial/archaeal transporter family protein
MSSAWILLAFLSTVLAALINILDSHMMARRMPGWRAYALICDLFTLPVGIVMLLLFPLPAGTGFIPLLAILASAVSSSGAIIIVLQAMKSESVARVAPITGTAPVFVAVLAMLFLGETIDWMQWLGILAVVTGGILISFKWDDRGSGYFGIRPFLLLISASILIAVSSVTNKYALGYMSFWNSASLLFISSALLFLAVCLRPGVLREIAALRERKLTVWLALGNQAASIVVAVLSYRVIELAPVALASTIFNSKPLFIFIFAGLTGQIAPGFLIHERGSRKVLFIRAAATLAVVGGLTVMLTL